MNKNTLLTLPRGTILYHRTAKNADGTPLRCRISGKPKTWKRDPSRFRVPVKYGLRTSFYIEPSNIEDWELPQ